MNLLSPPPVPDLDPRTLDAMRRGVAYEISNPALARRSRRPMAIGFAVAAALAVPAFVAINSLGAGTTAADATWSPTPQPITRAQLARAELVCRNDYAWRANGTATGAAAWVRTAPLVVAERRRTTFDLVLSDGSEVATCTLPNPLAHGPVATAGGFTGPQHVTGLTRPVGLGVTIAGGDSEQGNGNGVVDGQPRIFVYGRSGSDVRSIMIMLRNGASTTATVTKAGWWEVWYPEGLGRAQRLHSVQVTDAAGRKHTQPVHW